MKKNSKKSIFLMYFNMIFGCILGAASYPLFLVPNEVAPGGVTGLTTVLNVAFGWPVGITSLIFNIPLFLLCIATLGKKSFVKSLGATIVFSLLIDIFSTFMPPLTHNPMLATIYGGVMLGLGLGFILNSGATTGGTDLSAKLLHEKFKFMSIASLILLQDAFVVVLAGFVINVEQALYSTINIIVITLLVDQTMQGFNRAKACYILSAKNDDIKDILMKRINRGTTYIEARGGYTLESKPILLCIAHPREIFVIKNIVKEVDERAFMFITPAAEVLGEGFTNLKEQ